MLIGLLVDIWESSLDGGSASDKVLYIHGITEKEHTCIFFERGK
jgi:hypothetical protein